MAVRIALDLVQPLQISRRHVEDDAFGDHGDAVAPPVANALDDCRHEVVDDRLQPNRRLELLGDERQRRAGRLPDAEREVTRLAAHRDDEVPPRRRLGVDHQVLHDLDAVMPRRLVAERVDVGRQIEIVVDGLRHVDDADAPARARLEPHR